MEKKAIYNPFLIFLIPQSSASKIEELTQTLASVESKYSGQFDVNAARCLVFIAQKFIYFLF